MKTEVIAFLNTDTQLKVQDYLFLLDQILFGSILTTIYNKTSEGEIC
jgi:hypothetical protein